MTTQEIEEQFQRLNEQAPGMYMHWGSEAYGQEVSAIAKLKSGLIVSACDRFWLTWPELKRMGCVKTISGPYNHLDFYIA